MKVLKQVVLQKHNIYFSKLKQSEFLPELWLECVSLSNTDLTDKEIKLRVLLVRAYLWDMLKKSMNGVTAELKGEFKEKVAQNYSFKINKLINIMNRCKQRDEEILSKLYLKYVELEKKEDKIESYPDIKTKWSVGILKSPM